MLYLYLDESGDLGFDFVNRQPSRYFTVSVLAVKGCEQNRAVSSAVRLTLRRKLKALHGVYPEELKASRDSIEVKKYFFRKISEAGFKIYSMTLDKKCLFQYLVEDKARIYNYISRLVLDKVNFEDSRVRVILTVDKSKTRIGIRDFNSYIISQVKARLDPRIPLEILHESSHKILQLQAADLFVWGIFRKYERGDCEWLDVFKANVVFDGLYLG